MVGPEKKQLNSTLRIRGGDRGAPEVRAWDKGGQPPDQIEGPPR